MGKPNWIKPAADVAAEKSASALDAIDMAAERALKTHMPKGVMLHMEHERAAKKAREFKGNGNGNPPRAVQAHVNAKGGTAQEAADSIIAKAEGVEDAIDDIREARLAGREAVRNAAAEDIQAEKDAALQSILALHNDEGD